MYCSEPVRQTFLFVVNPSLFRIATRNINNKKKKLHNTQEKRKKMEKNCTSKRITKQKNLYAHTLTKFFAIVLYYSNNVLSFLIQNEYYLFTFDFSFCFSLFNSFWLSEKKKNSLAFPLVSHFVASAVALIHHL